MKTNIATTALQSQRLLRCGVSADTADMCYQFIDECVNNTDKPICNTPKEQFDTIRGYGFGNHRIHITPAWSLSALLSDILPHDIFDNEIDYSLFLQRRRSADNTPMWELSYYNLEYDATLLFVETDCPIEAATHMVEILINRGYKLNDCPCREKGGVE